jgi:hypothetical protein
MPGPPAGAGINAQPPRGGKFDGLIRQILIDLGQGWAADRVHLGWEQEKRKTSGAAPPLFPIRRVDVRSFR